MGIGGDILLAWIFLVYNLLLRETPRRGVQHS